MRPLLAHYYAMIKNSNKAHRGHNSQNKTLANHPALAWCTDFELALQ
jgi:hypothetical protein